MILSAVGTEAATLGRATGDLSGTSVRLTRSAERSAAEASSASAAAARVSADVSRVRDCADAMHASVGEISKGTSLAVGIAMQAVDAVRRTRATGDIESRVAAIQTDSAAAVAAINAIARTIEQINDAQTSVASVVDEETATSSAIGPGVRDAAQGSDGIAASAISVAQAVEEARCAAADTAAAADAPTRTSAKAAGACRPRALLGVTVARAVVGGPGRTQQGWSGAWPAPGWSCTAPLRCG